MKLPLQITFRNIEAPPEVEQRIKEKTAWLDRFYPRIVGCRVLVDGSNRNRKRGSLYHVRIDLTVPSAKLIVKGGPSLYSSLQRLQSGKFTKHLELRAPHKDMRQAIDDAFSAMRRRLEDYARLQRGDVKVHKRGLEERASRPVA